MRVVVVGKCHSRGIASSWQALRPDDEVASVTWVQLRKGFGVDHLLEEVSAADQVFLEANASGERDLSARELGLAVNDDSVPRLAAALESATLYPVMHFSGFHPDFLRVDRIGCSQLVVAAHALGRSEAQAAQLFNEDVYRMLGYFDEYEKAREFSLRVGRASGFDLSKVLEPVDRQPFMHIPTQPTIGFWMRFAAMLCEHAGVDYDPNAEAPFDEPGEELIWPVYPELADSIGVEGGMEFKVSKKYGPVPFEEMISAGYKVLGETDVEEVRGRVHTRSVIAKLRSHAGPTTPKSNVYSSLPSSAFWRRSVPVAEELDPVLDVDFTISPEDRVATAGSCFAQHISRRLSAAGYNYLVTEPAPEGASEPDSYGVFPARFGNVYTTAQLRQLFLRAYKKFTPKDTSWELPDGGFVDPFRPRIQTFASIDELDADRKSHLASVRRMFETCDVLVFTLGLTESWRSIHDGATVPLAPSVHGGADVIDDYEFHNLTVEEMLADLRDFLRRLRKVNPGVRVILTVSPVPLIATFTDKHVLVATNYSKSALRVVAEEISATDELVAYFPSFEIITSPAHRSRYYADDLREVTDEGVDHVMRVFSRHYLGQELPTPPRPTPSLGLSDADVARFTAESEVICDEEAIEET